MRRVILLYPFLLLLVCLGTVAGASAAEFDFQERFTVGGNSYRAEDLRTLFEGEDFAAIEAAAKELRDTSKTFPGGNIQLVRFYPALTGDVMQLSPADEQEVLRRIERWLEAYPDSVAAHITAAEFYKDLGYQERGTGWASSVTPAGWRRFQHFLKQGWDHVLAAHASETRDPHLYRIAYQIAALVSTDTEDFPFSDASYRDPLTGRAPGNLLERIYAHGLQEAPGYVPLHVIRAYYLTRRWGGRPGELETFAQRATDATRDALGATLYPWIYWSMEDSVGAADLHDFHRWDWDYLKQGYEELIEKHAPWPYWPQHFAYAACLMGKQEDAARLMDGWNTEPLDAIWGSEFAHGVWKAWAQDAGRYPFDAALQNAVSFESVERVKEVLANGSDPNHSEASDFPIIARALYKRNMEIVKVLREAGATLDNVTTYRAAAQDPSGEAVRYLIAEGVDPNGLVNEAYSLTHICARYGSEETMLACLDGGGDPSVLDGGGHDAVRNAVYRGNAQSLDVLLRKGANPNAKDKNDFSMIYLAVWYRHPDAAKVLVKHGANLYDGRLIRRAARPDATAMFETLFDLGLDPNSFATDGNALIHTSAQYGDADVIARCIARGGDINAPSKYGWTPLFLAAGARNAVTLRALLEAGADASVRVREHTLYSRAKERECTECIAILEAHGVTE